MTDDLGTRRGEREMLTGFLDWYRGVVEHKLDGLSLEQATRVMTPTGLSMLGVVKHLAWAESLWFRYRFEGDERQAPAVENEESFGVDPPDTVESVVDRYRHQCAEARRVVERAASLDELSTFEHVSPRFGQVSLRWILVHLIEETARHAGHLDIMRETIDGRTGD